MPTSFLLTFCGYTRLSIYILTIYVLTIYIYQTCSATSFHCPSSRGPDHAGPSTIFRRFLRGRSHKFFIFEPLAKTIGLRSHTPRLSPSHFQFAQPAAPRPAACRCAPALQPWNPWHLLCDDALVPWRAKAPTNVVPYRLLTVLIPRALIPRAGVSAAKDAQVARDRGPPLFMRAAAAHRCACMHVERVGVAWTKAQPLSVAIGVGWGVSRLAGPCVRMQLYDAYFKSLPTLVG
jgi:hypothetical protein